QGERRRAGGRRIPRRGNAEAKCSSHALDRSSRGFVRRGRSCGSSHIGPAKTWASRVGGGTWYKGTMRRAGVAALAVVGLAAASAFGQPRDKKAADALFKEGRAAFDKGDYPTACAKFEASLVVDPAIGTLLNLAVCEEKIGKLVASRKHLGELVP